MRLLILDLSTPFLPKEIGYYAFIGCPYQTAISFDFCFIADGNGGLQVFDVSCIIGCFANLGDVNDNGSITSLDASFLLQYIVGLIELTDSQKCKGDVNLSSSITTIDATYILQCSINLCSNLPSDFKNICYSNGNCP